MLNFGGKARALHARGGKIVVVGPRRTDTAEMADAHHFKRPGADVFFLLGMVQALLEEELVRPTVWRRSAMGSMLAARCGIDAATNCDLARTLAATLRAAIYGRLRTCAQQLGTMCFWLIV